jgi:hypothetical protein
MRPFESKKASTIYFDLDAWTLALIGPGAPFTSHYLLCCLVWGMWKDTADSSMVTIQSNIAMEWRRSSDMKAPQVLTLSFFMSWLRSLGTYRADFLER